MRSCCVSDGLAVPEPRPWRTALPALGWPDGAASARQRVDAGVIGQGFEVAASPLAALAGRRRLPACGAGKADACRAAVPRTARAGTASGKARRPHVDASGIRLSRAEVRGSALVPHVIPGPAATIARRARLARDDAWARLRDGLVPMGVGGASEQRLRGPEAVLQADGAAACSPQGPVAGSAVAGQLIGPMGAQGEVPIG